MVGIAAMAVGAVTFVEGVHMLVSAEASRTTLGAEHWSVRSSSSTAHRFAVAGSSRSRRAGVLLLAAYPIAILLLVRA